jgi:hypothetical protein
LADEPADFGCKHADGTDQINISVVLDRVARHIWIGGLFRTLD